ncbi:MAG: glycosyltransferase family 4 protein [Deltaproteobacteria bacterium]
MKLLIISPHFPNIRGGVADHTLHLAKALAEAGNEVSVLTSSDDRVIAKADNIEISASIENWGILGLPPLVRAIKRAMPDCVLIQYVPYMYSGAGVPVAAALLSIWLRFANLRVVATFHEIATAFNPAKPKAAMLSLAQRLVANVICRMAHGVVITAEAYRATICGFGAKASKIYVGSNILPVSFSDDDKRDFRRRLASPDEAIISTFGANPKRADVLIGAVKRLGERGVPSKLLILGGAPDEWVQTIRARVRDENLQEQVVITGYLESDDVFRYLSASDIFVILEGVSSEGAGGVGVKNTSLTAALAAGAPVIANRGHMTQGDYLSHRENAILIDSLDEESIASEIQNLLSDPALMKKLSSAALCAFNKELDWRAVARKYLKAISDASNPRP